MMAANYGVFATACLYGAPDLRNVIASGGVLTKAGFDLIKGMAMMPLSLPVAAIALPVDEG